MFKNVAAKFMVFAFDATTNVPKTGDAGNITAYVSKDYGTVTVLADTSATEMDATNAPGYYLFDAAQGETNADCLMVSAKSVTSNIKVIGAPAVIYTRPTTGWLAPTVAARTLDVSSTGEAGVDWANVGSPTTSLALTGTTIATTQKVDIETIKTNPVVNAGTVTFPTTATLASTTNITAGTVTTATNLTNAPTVGDFTATMKTSIGTAVAASAVASVTGNVGGNVTGSVGSVATGGISSASFAAGAITATALAADAITAAKVADNALPGTLKKSQALASFMFLMTDSTNHAPATGKTVTVTRSLDGGAFGAGTLSAVTEVSGGWYKCDFDTGDTNAAVVAFRATATGCDDTDVTLLIEP